MQAIRKVLVAVKNPDRRRQPGVDKALHIAKMLGAQVELFHAISTPVYLELEPLTGHTLAEIKEEALAVRRARLERIAMRARRAGIATRCSVEWDFPPHEAVLRRAHVFGADLIIAECHQGRRLKPWLMHLTDWELLRIAPVPVLILKSARRWHRPLFLAAVDTSHAHAKPARLDDQLVKHATHFSRATRGSLELMHANAPRSLGLMPADPVLDGATFAAVYVQLQAMGRRDFDAFAEKHRIPRALRHVVDDDAIAAIPRLARKLGAAVVVMGAVSRSGLKRVFIGNTAERVLADLPCDALVVKPAEFQPRVARRPRGVRVMPPQPILPLPI